MDFYRDAIVAIVDQDDSEILDRDSQRIGLMIFGKWIIENGENVSQSLDNLLDELKALSTV